MTYQELLGIVKLLNRSTTDDVHQGIINLIGVAGEVLEVMEMEDKPCAQNKKWRNTYPQDCQNIGYNQALREIKSKLGGNK